NALARRPKNMGNLSATWRWPADVSTTLALRYVGKTFNTDANTTGTKRYALTDLRAAWPINEHIEVFGRIENLFDIHYQPILNYGAAGRGGFAGVRARS